MQRIAAIAALLAVASADVSVAVTNGCDASCKVSDVVIHAPTSAPSPGSFSFDGTGTTSVAIDSSASMNLVVKLGGVQVLNKNVAGCGEQKISLPLNLGSVDVKGPTCPIAAGQSVPIGATVSSTVALSAKVDAVATFKQGSDTLVVINIAIAPQSLRASADVSCGAADATIWNATGYKNFQDEMTDCGKQCLGGESCVSSCMVKKENYSAACADCFGQLGQCTAKNCLTKCMGGRTPDCAQCVIAAGCNTAFAGCSGWQPPQ